VLAASNIRTMMMEAANTSETLVNFCDTTRRYNPEDRYLHTRLRDNLKFRKLYPFHFTVKKSKILFHIHYTPPTFFHRILYAV
jgi:hypothetical protein